MNRISALFVGIAALTAVSTMAEAAQGCGTGRYYDHVTHRCEWQRHHQKPGVNVDIAPGLKLHVGPSSNHHPAKHYTCRDHHCYRTD